LVVLKYLYIPVGFDWSVFYQPATLEMLHGHSPYSVMYFQNPPWIVVLFIPFALLPLRLGSSLLFVANLAAFAIVAYRLKAKPWGLFFFLLSFPVFACLWEGQIDGLLTLGLLMPQWLGLFLLLAKPQLGIGIAVFWVFQAWKEGGWQKVLRIFSPVAFAFIISFVIFGLYPLRNPDDYLTKIQNFSMWPVSIPFGVAFLLFSVRKKDERLAMISSPLLSPYVQPQSWSIAILGVVHEYEVAILTISSWIVKLLYMHM
jgi:hypothetical protein